MRQTLPRGRLRAAEYVRMSTDHQLCSIPFQRAEIARRAAERGYDIVPTYADEGVSGLTLERREGLKRMLADVISGRASFERILVYDVSRWGRFQDPDQAAHYEVICKQAGVRVEYCIEPFEDDASVASALVKQLKRAMAAEYSRDVSERVRQAKAVLTRKGYWQGAAAPYGLRRMLLDRNGAPVRVLSSGERKSLPDGRVKHACALAPGKRTVEHHRQTAARQRSPVSRRLSGARFIGGR